MTRSGRPKCDDEETLLKMAAVLLDNTELPIATAVRMVADFEGEQSEESAIRRLRDKFNLGREEYLKHARTARQEQRQCVNGSDGCVTEIAPGFGVSIGGRAPLSRQHIEQLSKLLRKTELGVDLKLLEGVRDAFERFKRPEELEETIRAYESVSKTVSSPEYRKLLQTAQYAADLLVSVRRSQNFH